MTIMNDRRDNEEGEEGEKKEAAEVEEVAASLLCLLHRHWSVRRVMEGSLRNLQALTTHLCRRRQRKSVHSRSLPCRMEMSLR